MTSSGQAKIDIAAATIAATAPAWVEPLSNVNTILATVSLILGIGFAIARIYLYLKNKEK